MSLAKFLTSNTSGSGKTLAKRACFLKSLNTDLNDIQLVEGKNEIGRSKETGIRETFVSKKQLQLHVSTDNFKVLVKVLGTNASGLNGLMLLEGTECEAEHGDIIEILYDRFKFEVKFDPEPSSRSKIRKIENTAMEESNDSSIDGTWESLENGKLVIYNCSGAKSSEKIASYDLDGTIITTKSGNVFPKNTFDWEILYPDVPGKLKNLHQDGYKICFFTNQAGIAKGKVKLDDFKLKIKAILSKLKVPVQVFIAVGDGFFRKPAPGMWNHLVEQKNAGIKVNLDKSFYVGDAAGRPKGTAGLKRGDHSCSDRLFAMNVGLKFYTPEEHFLNKKPTEWNRPDFDPTKLNKLPLYEPESTKVPLDDGCEIIILVGMPGSGKSHYAQNVLKPLGYSVLNADKMGSVQSCLTACEKNLQSGRKCVIDNTNVDPDSRKKFISLASRHKATCRAFLMNTTVGQIKHNIAFRHLTDKTHSKISEMIINVMKKKFQKPEISEGFKEVVSVNLVYQFNSPEEENLYKLYLVEK